MSRIQKALEKARLSQGTGVSQSLSDVVNRRKKVVTPDQRSGAGERLSEIKMIGAEPPVEVLQANRIVSGLTDGESNAVDAYKMLRTKTLRRLIANDWRVLAITSTVQGEGKTLTALNLAISISQDPNFEVILVDADLRSPSVHKRLGVEPKFGLSDYLEGAVEWRDIIFSPQIPGIGIIPNVHSVENSSESLTSERMRELMLELRTLSPTVIVIVDMPPLVVDDVLAFAPLVDSLMLVFKAGVTNRADVAAAREMTADLPVLGCIMNGTQGGKGNIYY